MITTTLHPALNTTPDNNVDGIQIDHHKLLADLVESNFPLITIANDHGLNLAQLIAWAAQAPVRSLLDAADELATRIAAHKAAQGRPAAVQTLIGQTWLCESPRDRDLASRAARTLVRITTPAKRPRKPRAPRNRNSLSGSPSRREGVGGRLSAAAGASPIPESLSHAAIHPRLDITQPFEPIERPAPAALHAASGTTVPAPHTNGRHHPSAPPTGPP